MGINGKVSGLIIGTVAVLCVCLKCTSVSSSEATMHSKDQLSVKETLGAAFLAQEGTPLPIFRAAHPDARKGLYKILEQRSLAIHHPNCIAMLGFCGTEEDVPR